MGHTKKEFVQGKEHLYLVRIALTMRGLGKMTTCGGTAD